MLFYQTFTQIRIEKSALCTNQGIPRQFFCEFPPRTVHIFWGGFAHYNLERSYCHLTVHNIQPSQDSQINILVIHKSIFLECHGNFTFFHRLWSIWQANAHIWIHGRRQNPQVPSLMVDDPMFRTKMAVTGGSIHHVLIPNANIS